MTSSNKMTQEIELELMDKNLVDKAFSALRLQLLDQQIQIVDLKLENIELKKKIVDNERTLNEYELLIP